MCVMWRDIEEQWAGASQIFGKELFAFVIRQSILKNIFRLVNWLIDSTT